MKLKTPIEIEDFIQAVDQCHDQVWLKSVYGDQYNLKSVLSRYIAIGKMIDEQGDLLELFCDSKNDEKYFFSFFQKYPDTL